MATGIVPTFLLKGISFNEVFKKYKNGYFTEEKEKCQIISAKVDLTLNPAYSTDRESGVFTCKDKHNKNYVIATTGHENIRLYMEDLENLKGGRCHYCAEDFEGDRVGYPVKHEENPIVENGVYRIINVFWTEGIFCSFECCLAFVRKNMIKPYNFRDIGMEDSELLLKYLYRLMYPNNETLKPAPDLGLLISNGGSLTHKEWHSGKHEFMRSIKITTVPAKTEYFMK